MYQINSFLSAAIKTVGDSQEVTVFSKIHVRNVAKMPTTFSTEFTHAEILDSSEFKSFIKRFL